MPSRALLTSAVLTLVFFVASALGPVPESRSGPGSEDTPRLRISHGPMLGRPGPRQMGVWARTSRPGRFRVRYGLTPERLDRLSQPVTTRLEDDCTGHLILSDLQPATRYHYEVVAEGQREGPGGSFRTWPEPAAFHNPKHNPRGLYNFRFEVACCNNQGEHSLGPALPAFKTMLTHLRDKVDFAILNGDWLYEEARDFSPQAWRREVGAGPQDSPRVVELVPPVTGVWRNYQLYLERGRPLAEWHRHVPTFYTLDDHEILNDVVACGQTGLRHRRAVFRDPAIQAWFDYLGWSNPVAHDREALFGRARVRAGQDVLEDEKAAFDRVTWQDMANLHVHWGTPDAGVNDPELDKQGGDPNAGVYEVVQALGPTRLRINPPARQDGEVVYSVGRRTYGRFRVANCDFYLLDTRSHRQKHDIKDPGKAGVSMLGGQQRKWLTDEMRKSDADFFFIVSSVNFTIPHDGAGGMAYQAPDKDDAWTAFLHERETLIDFFDTLGKPVLVLTGDLHNSFAIRVTDNVWEFASGPHNSRNHPASSEGGRPANGVFNSRGRKVDIRWSSYLLDDVPQELRLRPIYGVVQVNNVFNNPVREGQDRWVAFPRPQLVFQYYDGLTGDLLYAEAVRSGR